MFKLTLCQDRFFFVKLRLKTSKTNSKIQKYSKTSRRFQMHRNASECIPAGPNRSEWVRMGPNTSANFETLAKSLKNYRKLEKLREHVYKNFFPAQSIQSVEGSQSSTLGETQFDESRTQAANPDCMHEKIRLDLA